MARPKSGESVESAHKSSVHFSCRRYLSPQELSLCGNPVNYSLHPFLWSIPGVASGAAPRSFWPSVFPFHSYKQTVIHCLFHATTPQCNVLGFQPAGGVSSSSTLWIFQGSSYLWQLFSPPVHLLGHFLWLQCVQNGLTEDWEWWPNAVTGQAALVSNHSENPPGRWLSRPIWMGQKRYTGYFQTGF